MIALDSVSMWLGTNSEVADMNPAEHNAEYSEALERLAPCGLDCNRCFMRQGGAAQRTAKELREAAAGFDKMAARVADRMPALANYQGFEQVLDFLCSGTCRGCREGGAELPFCAARTCFREKGVDFCFQCDAYPCTRNSYPENLAVRWRRYQDRMREVGVAQFYREQLVKPRYE